MNSMRQWFLLVKIYLCELFRDCHSYRFRKTAIEGQEEMFCQHCGLTITVVFTKEE
jgi:hypothetical protein